MNTNSIKLYPLLALAAMALSVSVPAMAAGEDNADPEPPEISDQASGEPDRAADASTADEEQSAAPEAPTVEPRTEHGQTITEYRRQGQVFMMTVKPRAGPKQYWDDPDGDGQFQRSTSSNVDESINVPKWRLGSW